MIVQIMNNDGPLCPRNGADDPAHRAHVALADRFSTASQGHRADVEGVLEDVYFIATRGAETMNLYVETVGAYYLNDQVLIEAWYFKCPTCGLIIPAGRKP